jgi:acyl-CoA thioesterase II
MKQIDDLLNLIDLEQIEENIFRGQTYDIGNPIVFGGQVLSQALHAAIRTTPAERYAHSMHGYFILPGDIHLPIVYEVERLRDGKSFTTRRVKAIQKGQVIFNMAASFQIEEMGYDHQIDMPESPPPDNLWNIEQLAETIKDQLSSGLKRFFAIERPIEFRPVDIYNPVNPGKKKPFKRVWMKAKGQMSDKKTDHQTALAYASDYNLLDTAILAHGDKVGLHQIQMASLDHAMWFHRDFRMDEWLLYAVESPSSSNARGFTRGNIFTQEGILVASVVQEGLIRPQKS